MTSDGFTEDDMAVLEQAAGRQAAADQEAAEWGHKADKIVTYWTRLREAGMGKQLAGVLTIGEVNHIREMEAEAVEE